MRTDILARKSQSQSMLYSLPYRAPGSCASVRLRITVRVRQYQNTGTRLTIEGEVAPDRTSLCVVELIDDTDNTVHSIDLFAYPRPSRRVVRILKRFVSIPLDKRKCVVYSRDAERLLSAFDLASSRCSRHGVEALPGEYERANDMAEEELERRIRSSRAREQKREEEERKGTGGRERHRSSSAS
ncbi:hypothetical protein ALC62_07753 [Cyphomyrmex costatus]|uniref:Uncharacterized protein n=1 Tax=Cyphomyrmex costatus TaxID=456900 RepID=A0A195CLH2_9HYME|nr:hypothetical protein ALC62_07753 [Cyphomyrmex costatus]